MRLTRALIDEIRALLKGGVQLDVPLSRYTSFRIGGPADLVAEPESAEDLIGLLTFVREHCIPRILLGAGTNVLFHDAGFRGVIIRMNRFRETALVSNGSDHARIKAGAGTPLPSLIDKACKEGWTGLEPLWGIPGTFGGAIVTNAGAGGACTGDLLASVTLLTASNQEIVLSTPDIRYGYRSMELPADAVVIEGTLRLPKGESGAIDADLERARTRRRASQPRTSLSAGCVFKNPSRDAPAGAIIDRLGFKGVSVGGAQVSDAHANFIVNRGDALASDVMELIERIRERVWIEEHVTLDLEIRIVGEEARDD